MSGIAADASGWCADASSAAGEALAGTATRAVEWLVVEQRGAWGRDAVADTGLPDGVRDLLEAFPGRALLIRRPDRRGVETVVFRGRTDEAGGTLSRTALPTLAALADDREDDGDGDPVAEPLLLVCAHGRRDPCCARLGPPLFDALAPHVDPALLWQSSHHGGHRFAANVLALPTGVQLGRVAPGDAARVASLLANGRIPLDLYRGRTLYAPNVQAAEVAVRRHLGLERVADLALLDDEGDEVSFSCTAGVVRATVTATAGPPVPPSCGAEPEPTVRYAVDIH